MNAIQFSTSINIGKLTTFGISAHTKEYAEIHSRNDLNAVLDYVVGNSKNYFILGGGSNTIFLKDFDGIVIHVKTKGIKKIDETENDVFIEVQAGENWDEFVEWSVFQSYYGIENLAAIPGTVGASPIQNIGAYGCEVKDTIVSVEYKEILSGKIMHISNEECHFGYRDSIFKNKLKSKTIVLSVVFKLSKIKNLKLEYADVKNELNTFDLTKVDSKLVYNCIKNIRDKKLPKPEITGNSGSFFKNPVINSYDFEILSSQFPEIKYFNQEDGNVKLAAAWLIEQCGWKGKSHGGCKVHEKQALVITNSNQAKAVDLIEIIEHIQQAVFSKFCVKIEAEVNLIK